MTDAFHTVVGLLCPHIRQPLLQLSETIQRKTQEIRLRINQPLSLTVDGAVLFVTPNGQAVNCPEQTVICRKSDLLICFKSICEYSVYSYQNQINNGFITLKGGHRVGICGTAVCENGKITNLKNISYFNIRIAKAFDGCAKPLLACYRKRGIYNTVLVGPPFSGKTTMLRDIAKALSDGAGVPPQKVCVVDERDEICGMSGGEPAFDMGVRCDCMGGYPKAQGLIFALKCMSPQVAVLDEIGTAAEFDAVAEGLHAGVVTITSMHAADEREFCSRTVGRQLLDSGLFHYFVFLSDHPGNIRAIYERGAFFDQNVRDRANQPVSGSVRIDESIPPGNREKAVLSDFKAHPIYQNTYRL